MIRLARSVYRDKVRACWLGKTIGGTLGAPFEGQMRTLNLDFYSPIPAQAAPNDDLDLQLVWLERLRRVGPSLTSNDLAAAWQDHILYPYDEYGFGKANLRRGITPPLSGSFNNPFFDCMGAPIRSEIWALVAPAAPSLAAVYAFKDAVVDHKEDGVWGEMFFAALESAAFVISDPLKLIEIGRAMIPAESRTSRVVQMVLAAHSEDVSWEKARERVLKDFGSPNFTNAPQNIGFTLIGWLWHPNDFGAAICCAVNCGYDTDCTGATLGSILGIIGGTAGLPDRWLRPIGEQVVAGWGITGLDLPKTVDELTDRTITEGQRTLADNRASVELIDDPAQPVSEEPAMDSAAEAATQQSAPTKPPLRELTPDELFAALADNSRVRGLWTYNWLTMESADQGLTVVAAFEKLPSAIPGETTPIVVTLSNSGAEGLSGMPRWTAPPGWDVAARHTAVSLAPGEATNIAAVIKPPNSIPLAPSIPVELGFAGKTVSFHLVPAMRWGVVGPFPNIVGDAFNKHFPPEDNPDPKHPFLLRSDIVETYEIRSFRECRLDIDRHFRGSPGTIYLRTWVIAPNTRTAQICMACNDGAQVWTHRQPTIKYHQHDPVVSRQVAPYVQRVEFQEGRNELLVKLIRCEGPVEAVFYVTDTDGHPMVDLQFTFGET